MRRTVLFAAAAFPVMAASITITPLGTTATQAAFRYCESATATISLTAYPAGLASYTPNDVNSSLFSGSNADTRVPAALVAGSCKTLVLGAQLSALASDGNYYSRALQANTIHVLTLTAGSDSGTLTFSTTNPALGNSSPAPPPFTSGEWGNYSWPSMSWASQNCGSAPCIDPNTGVVIKRLTGPGQAAGGEATIPAAYAIDVAGSAWTTPANILGSSGYASTAATGSMNALYIPVDSTIQPSFTTNSSFDDVLFSIGSAYASGAGGQISLCLTITHGQSCVGTPFTISVPNGSGSATTVSGPSSFPDPLFAGWGSPKITAEQATNLNGIISVSGTTATFVSNLGQSTFFPLSLVGGDHILIAGSATTCPNNDCTISALVNNTTLTLNQNLGSFAGFSTTLNGGISIGATTFTVASATGFFKGFNGGFVPTFYRDKYYISFNDGGNAEIVYCTTVTGAVFSGCEGSNGTGLNNSHSNGAAIGSTAFSLSNFGVMIWNSGSGTVNLQNASYAIAGGANFTVGDDGQANLCSVSTVTVSYEADGMTPLSPPQTGRTCQLLDSFGNPGLYLFIPQTGESRLIVYGDNVKGSNTNQTISASDPNTVYYAQNNSSNPNVYKCVYNAATGNYASLAAAGSYTGASQPNYTCTVITSGSGNDLLTQVHNATGANVSYFSRVSGFGPLIGNYAAVTVQLGQNSIGYVCWFDVTQAAGSQIVACHDSWTTYPERWSGMHGLFNVYTSAGWGAIFASGLTSQGTTGIGQYQLTINSIANNGGATTLTSSFVDPSTCSARGVPDARWVALGATGNNCIQMVVATEPQNVAPSAADKAQWPSACNGTYAQLQTIQPGDYLTDGPNAGGEQFLVALKIGSGCSPITLVLARGANLQCASAPTSHSSGWTPVVQATQNCTGNIYWSQESAPTTIYVDASNIDTGHSFIGPSDNTGTNLIKYTAYSSLQGYNSYGAQQGSLPSIISQTYNYGMDMVYPFAGATVNSYGNSVGGVLQSHPGGKSYLAPVPTLGYDGRPIGAAAGGLFDQPDWYHTLTLVSGQSNTYLISQPLTAATGGATMDTANPKTIGWSAWAGRFTLKDISGPSSVIGDSTTYSFCYAYNAGECVSGSTAGNRYVSVPNIDTTGICYNAAPDRNTPCLASLSVASGQATEYSWAQNDPNAQYWRLLGWVFNGPGVPPNYWNVHGIVDGTWALTDVFWKEGVRKDIVAIQLPPWPPADTLVRSNFVPVPIRLNGQTGDLVRIRFGYNTSLFCTSRQEQCSTAGAGPYTWLSEPQTWSACSGSCEVDIPTLGGRILYYVVDRQNASGSVTSGTLQAVATP